MPARVTLLHVAEDAGVSRATASLVLRGSPLVGEKTHKRVQESMRKLGYVRNRGAATLRTNRSEMIGVIVPDVTNPFFAELTVGSAARLEEANHVVLLGNSNEDLGKQERLLRAMLEHSADGVLLCPAVETVYDTIELVRSWQIPCVLIVRYLADIEADYVGADDRRGAEAGIEHLIAHGHRRIAFIGGHPHSSARRDRLIGYRTALERHGLAVDEALVVPGPPTRDGGYGAILRLLESAHPLTAALCYNDVVAFGVQLGLRAAGRVPGQDFAVIGFDNIAEAALWQPPLTTLSLDPRRLGEEAASLLLERIAQRDREPRRIILIPELIVRDSCGYHYQKERAL